LFQQDYGSAASRDRAKPDPAIAIHAQDHVDAILAHLLNSRFARYLPEPDASELTEQLDALVAREILAMQNGAYRASDIALYSLLPRASATAAQLMANHETNWWQITRIPVAFTRDST
jgi:hypothetical protein